MNAPRNQHFTAKDYDIFGRLRTAQPAAAPQARPLATATPPAKATMLTELQTSKYVLVADEATQAARTAICKPCPFNQLWKCTKCPTCQSGNIPLKVARALDWCPDSPSRWGRVLVPATATTAPVATVTATSATAQASPVATTAAK